MSNVQTNRQTDLIYGDYTFDNGLAESIICGGPSPGTVKWLT